MTCKVALIGYGAIARSVCATLAGNPDIAVGHVLVRPERVKEVMPMLPSGTMAVTSLDALPPDIDFLLECAGHEAVRSFGPVCLSRGIDFGVISAGALAAQETLESLRAAALAGQARLVIVPGAIGGVDALSAAGKALTRVVYTARKPPMSWSGSPAEETHDLAAITKPTAVFEGSARAAAMAFPKNANVVATVALAGAGFDATEVTLIADPSTTGNGHHIRATGPLFDLDYRTQGAALPDNPKTSALTAYSAVRTLLHRSHGVLV